MIRRGIGATIFLRTVRSFNGCNVELSVDSHCNEIEQIAGMGMARKIDEGKRLIKKYGGERGEWMKFKGVGKVDVPGIISRAHLHWYEMGEDGIGYEMKVTDCID